MQIGFTGTRKGMTPAQLKTVDQLLAAWPQAKWAHHGMAEGADAQFHRLAEARRIPTHGHPGVLPGGQPYQRSSVTCTVTSDENLMLIRNREIVRAVDVMIATPGETTERMRGSGTWATIRYARKVDRWLIIVWPDGHASENKPY